MAATEQAPVQCPKCEWYGCPGGSVCEQAQAVGREFEAEMEAIEKQTRPTVRRIDLHAGRDRIVRVYHPEGGFDIVDAQGFLTDAATDAEVLALATAARDALARLIDRLTPAPPKPAPVPNWLDAITSDWHAGRNRWEPCPETAYDSQLGIAPPKLMAHGAFLAGEPWDHTDRFGEWEPVYTAFRRWGTGTAARRMTERQFRDNYPRAV